MDTDERSGLVVAAAEAHHLTDIERRPDVVIAADRGLHAVMGRGWIPDCIVGDMDSVDAAALAAAEAAGAVVERHAVAKDESDLELGLLAALRRRVSAVHVVARDGGRLDHQLGNLFALAAPSLHPMRVTATIGHHRVWVVRDVATPDLAVGEHLAIHAIGGPATVTSSGVAFPLSAEELSPFEARGIANSVVGVPAIEVSDGVVLVVSSPADADLPSDS